MGTFEEFRDIVATMRIRLIVLCRSGGCICVVVNVPIGTLIIDAGSVQTALWGYPVAVIVVTGFDIQESRRRENRGPVEVAVPARNLRIITYIGIGDRDGTVG